MNFRFHPEKAKEATAVILNWAGGRINIMKLIKLLYLLDRDSINLRRTPVVGGDYLSMKNGPVISELLDLINEGELWNFNDAEWSKYIGERIGHEIALKSDPGREHLSDAEIELAGKIWEKYGRFDQFELRDICHDICKEWTPLKSGRADITIEHMGKALGKDENEIRFLQQEAKELNKLDAIFASP